MTTTEITEYDHITADIAVGTRLYNEATVIAFRKVQDFRPAEPRNGVAQVSLLGK